MAVTQHPRVVGRATSAVVHSWQVQSSVVADQPGEVVSRADYRPDGWYRAPARSTVMAVVLAAGEYPDVLRSTRMRDAVDASRFQVPWWYRTPFDITAGGRTLLRLEGVIHRAELWVNGVQVAGPDEIAGAYPVTTFDVTGLVHPGTNAMALLVMPGHPATDLSIGWIDWNPTPPDANMGVWRDVHILRTGEIRLADPYVVTDLIEPEGRARLRVGVEVDSAAPVPRTVTVTGTIARIDTAAPAGAAGSGAAERRFCVDITVPPGPALPVTLDAADVPELVIDDPALWWPAGHGAQPLYELRLVAAAGGEVSDQAVTTFGIRQVDSRIEDGGGRRFLINGRPVQVLGAGWCPDIFLRHDGQRCADQLGYVIDMGLNAIRLEGKLENPELFELADRLGVMVLPGWECCTKWESHAGTGSATWTEHDYLIARRSMAGQARLLRNHPSVICFLIGSDFAPPERIADVYLQELRAAGWATPIVSSGASKWNNEEPGDPGADARPDTSSTAGAGPSGMKMWPYDWVPPVYWYAPRYGGAVGFDSECSAGHCIPRLPSLQRMLTPAEIDLLWQQPDAHHYHAAPRAPFSTLAIFHEALARRYGPIGGLRDFLRKAQLANYEAVRAQFEAYGSRFRAPQPATGMIYWMLNGAWPGLTWQLFDHYLDPAAAYFGAKKANEPVHVQLAYDTGEVLVVNHTPNPVGPFTARILVRGIDGAEVASDTRRVDAVPGCDVATTGRVAVPDGLSPTYFVELDLHDGGGASVSRNVYWMSTRADVLDWDRTTWQYTPQQQHADLSGLTQIPVVGLTVDAEVGSAAGTDLGSDMGSDMGSDVGPDIGAAVGAGVHAVTAPADGGVRRGAGIAGHRLSEPEETMVVTVRNPTADPAVGIHLSLAAPGARDLVAPVLWQDNDITLFGGQHAVVSARYSRAGLPSPPLVHVEGFNVTDRVVRPGSGPAVAESGR